MIYSYAYLLIFTVAVLFTYNK